MVISMVKIAGSADTSIPSPCSSCVSAQPTIPSMVQEFCEECQGQKKVVMRDPKLKDNALLPAAVEVVAGDSIYKGLRDGFRVWSQDWLQ